jgi:hypothetical protein
MTQSCTARSSGSMTIPDIVRGCTRPNAPGGWPRLRRKGGSRSGVSNIATYTVRPAEPSWARTISNRRLLVSKAEPGCPPRFTRCHSVLECPVQRLLRVHSVPRIVGLCLPVLAHSWHNGGLVVRRAVAFAWRTRLFTARPHAPPSSPPPSPPSPPPSPPAASAPPPQRHGRISSSCAQSDSGSSKCVR